MQLGTGPQHRSPTPLGAAERAQLERILANPLFARSERLSTFLRFVVEQTLDGYGSSIKEQVIGSELYGKGPEFDRATDPIVRVDARRLRDKLREYYAEFPRDPIRISLPKGSYVPLFEENAAAAPELPEPVAIRLGSGRRWLAGTVGLAAVVAPVLVWSLWHKTRPEATRLVRLTPFPGQKGPPALSPDGRFVAFSSAGPEGVGEPDIWVKAVHSEALRRLTLTPQFAETSPAWSPNGREIAFVRRGEGVFIVSDSGDAERKVSASGTDVGWTPDGNSILIRDRDGNLPFGIYQILLDNLERRQLTKPATGVGDGNFSVSPDGSSVAFIRHGHSGIADLYLVSIQGGEPRRLTNWDQGQLNGVAWTADGRDLIYSNGRLWRIPANAAQPGRGSLVQNIAVRAAHPSISRPLPGTPVRLAFRRILLPIRSGSLTSQPRCTRPRFKP